MTDIRGKSIDEAMANTAAWLDKQIEAQLERAVIVIADQRPTDDEMAAFIQDQQRVLEAWKAETLAEMRRSLIDSRAPSLKAH